MYTLHKAKTVLAMGAVGLMLLPYAALPGTAHAAVSDWMRGASMVPTSTTDFSSDSFKQSLRNLKSTGATYVSLVVPFYQSNIYSTDVQNGWNTPTDQSLGDAIDYAHSIGLAVALNIHDDPYDGQWRANINPSDRAGWFSAYDSKVLHVAQIAQQHHAELIVIGTELVRMASAGQNSTNTGYWLDLISQIRKIYSGKLTYSANSNNNNPSDNFDDEKASIGFWGALDYVGLSAYYGLNSDGSVQGLENAWDYWNSSDIRPFQQKVGKPILFIEEGYRSVSGAHNAPWNWQMGGSPDMTEQSNDYQAFFDYWNKYPYIQGAFMWDWETNPNAGGTNSTSYTPQNKPAQQVMTQWFTNPTQPPNNNPPPSNFQTTMTVNPSSPAAGTNTTLSANVTASGGSLQNGIVDLEVYNSSGQKVFQKYFDGQNLSSGASQTYTAQWTPSSAGQYRATVGVFSSGWSSTLFWENTAANITVGNSTSGGTPTGNQTTDIWWPTNGAHVSGIQPFKAMVENVDVSQYDMYWQVDGGGLVPMGTNTTDYPHKEAAVDLSGWNWKGAGPYTINFVSKDKSGNIISQKSVQIWTQ